MGDRLRPTWDFDDLDGSQHRFRALLEEEQTDAGRAEILTQLARIEGLRDRFDAGTRCSTRPRRLPARRPSYARASTSSGAGCAARVVMPRPRCRCSRPHSRRLARYRTSSSRLTLRTWLPSQRRTSRRGSRGRTEASTSPVVVRSRSDVLARSSSTTPAGTTSTRATTRPRSTGSSVPSSSARSGRTSPNGSSMRARRWRRLAASSSPRRQRERGYRGFAPAPARRDRVSHRLRGSP